MSEAARAVHLTDLRGRAWPWLLLIVLVAVLIRLPYWEVIPASFDEVEQTSYAYQIAQGQFRPLVGNDAYAGPFYFYLVAGLIRLGVTNPMIGRVVILLSGILTVPVTYGWVQAMGKNKPAGLIAASFVALSPDLIVVNSHLGGTTMLLPLLATLFLLGLTLAVERDSAGWLLFAGVAAGLALQSNLVAGLATAGGLLWFLWQTRGKPRLGKWWPFWPIVGGLIVLIVFSPVIIYNLSNDLGSLAALEGKSYLWEDNPSVATTLNNVRRLFLQLGRQGSGVLTGDEEFGTLIGFPLLYLGLMAGGLAYTSYRVSTLPLLIIAPFALIMPIISSHYGFATIGRFTTLLIPVWAAVISFLLVAAVGRLAGIQSRRWRNLYGGALLALSLLLIIYPVSSLFRYYRAVNEAHNDGRALLELTRYAVSNNRGEPVYLSAIEELFDVRGIPYVPHAAFLLGDIYHEFLTPPEIIGRLFENPTPAFFLLSERDAAVLSAVIPLERVAIAANEVAGLRNYGLYRLESAEGLQKPDFVLGAADVPGGLAPTVTIGEGIQLLGCDTPQLAASGDSLSVNCYWQALHDLPPNRYIGFVHLIDPATSTLIAQDDHILGQESYPLNAWQPGEVIRESFTVAIPNSVTAGEYRLVVGIYTWPDLTRLSVPGSVDNVVALPPVQITPVQAP